MLVEELTLSATMRRLASRRLLKKNQSMKGRKTSFESEQRRSVILHEEPTNLPLKESLE